MRLKKIISVLIAALFILGAAPAAFAAGETVTQDNITYMLLNDGTYAVKEAVNCSENVEIPSDISGVAVTQIMGNAFASMAAILKSVTIPASVKMVNAYAFRNCTGLQSVVFRSSGSAVTIKNEAFSGCGSLESIELPANITAIPDRCFYNCSKLAGISIPTTVKTIGSEAFLHCSSLLSVTIPASVTSIGDEAFYNCTSVTGYTVSGGTSDKTVSGVLYTYDGKTLVQYPLGSSSTSFSVPSGVTEIGAGAFAFGKLIIVRISEGVAEIGKDAFNNATSLSSVNIPLSTETIGTNAFKDCGALKVITLPARLSSYEGAFVNCGAEKVTLACGITEIPTRAFAHCVQLENVFIPASVETIAPGAFANCSGFTINAPKDSYAIQCASDNGINYAICSDDDFHLDLDENGYCDGCNKKLDGSEEDTETDSDTNPTQTKPTETKPTEKPTKPTVTENPVAKVKISVPASGTVRWKYRVKMTAKASGLPKGYHLEWWKGKEAVSKTATLVTGPLTDKTNVYTAKICDSSGKPVSTAAQEKSATVTVTVQTGFFAKIISFFTRLFGSDLVELK